MSYSIVQYQPGHNNIPRDVENGKTAGKGEEEKLYGCHVTTVHDHIHNVHINVLVPALVIPPPQEHESHNTLNRLRLSPS